MQNFSTLRLSIILKWFVLEIFRSKNSTESHVEARQPYFTDEEFCINRNYSAVSVTAMILYIFFLKNYD